MKREILDETRKMAKAAGYHDVRRAGKWKGYEVIEPIFTDGKFHFCGLPQYILCKGEALRWAEDYEEILDIMDTL